MPMKIRLCAALLLAATVLLAGCAAEAAASAPNLPVSAEVSPAPAAQTPVLPAEAPTEPEHIAKEEAIAIALADAGLAEDRVIHRRAEPDYEKGQPVYEVEFYSDGQEYDYDIHAVTGEILSRKSEPEKPGDLVPENTAPPATEAPDPDRITKEAAISIALADAGFTEDQVTRLKAEFDYDDGRPEYEVEFHKDGYEYNYDIHAETGKILSKDREWDD